VYRKVLVAMKTFAQISGNFVVNIIVAEQSYIESLPIKDQFVEYDQTNQAGIGYTYDSTTGLFSPPVVVAPTEP